jgi:hypothetical protein
MARPKRIDLPSTLYYVFSSTIEGAKAFRDQRDRKEFLGFLATYSELFSFKVHTYCLVPKSFSLLVESGDRSGLSEFMRRLLTVYTVYCNRRHKRRGHLFYGRFKSCIVDNESGLIDVSRFIHLAPSREKGKSSILEKYAGSSLHHYINGDEPDFLYTEDVLAGFNMRRDRYLRFVQKGLKEEVELNIIQQRFIGSPEFVDEMTVTIAALGKSGTSVSKNSNRRKKEIRDIDRRMAEDILQKVSDYYQCTTRRIKIGRYNRGEIGDARTILIGLLRQKLPWTCEQIAHYVGLHEKSGINNYLKRISEDKELSEVYKILASE